MENNWTCDEQSLWFFFAFKLCKIGGVNWTEKKCYMAIWTPDNLRAWKEDGASEGSFTYYMDLG